MNIGVVSVIPAILVIIMAFKTKNVLLSLLAGIISAGSILDYLGEETFFGLKSAVYVFESPWVVKSLLFCLLIGGFVTVVEESGGVKGLIAYIACKKKFIKSPIGAQLLAYVIGVLMFIDGTSSIIISGITAKPLFDHYNVSRKKLAYITDSTSSPVAWLIPFNGAGAFLSAMVATQIASDINPMDLVIKAVPYQLYSIVSIILVGIVIFKSDNKAPNDIAEDMIFDSDDDPLNMIVPTLTLIVSILAIFATSGDGSDAIYQGGMITLIISGIYFTFFKKVSVDKYLDWVKKGMSGYLEFVIILLLAFAFSNLIGKLGTGGYLAGLSGNMMPAYIPVLIFLLGTLMSFTTGTSAGTVSILLPLALPLAIAMNISLPVVIGAVVSGGVFGDHCSPISDSTILASMISDVEVMEHVTTQIPYSITAAAISGVGFLLLGIFSI